VIDAKRIAVVIPCYRVREHVLGVIAAIPAEVDAIYVVDDACPQQSGDLVAAECRDPVVGNSPSSVGIVELAGAYSCAARRSYQCTWRSSSGTPFSSDIPRGEANPTVTPCRASRLTTPASSRPS